MDKRRYRSLFAVGLLGGVLAVATGGAPAYADNTVTATFGATGGEQSWAVPAGVSQVHIVAIGARGGKGGDGGDGSAPDGRRGQRLETDLSLPSGVRTLYVEVGQVGGDGHSGGGGQPGFGGANVGGDGAPFSGAAGGGASDVRTCPIGGPCDTLASRLAVGAGGGGGGGRCFAIGCSTAGDGGDASDVDGGSFGIPTFPGGVPGNSGGFGQAGGGGLAVPTSTAGGGGGGGGGWYGGGGAASGGFAPTPLIVGVSGGTGGNGSSHAGPGTSNATVAETDDEASVTISYQVYSTTLAYTGATSGPIGSPATLKARLTTTGAGSPVPGAAVRFSLGTQSTCTGTTDGNGVATCQATPTGPASDVTLHIAYDGDPTHLPSTVDRVFTVTRKATTLTYAGATQGDFHDPATVKAKLTLTDTGAAVPGKPVVFKLNDAETCTGTTDDTGFASCVITPQEPAGNYPLTAVFAGDEVHLPSNATATFGVTKEETALSYAGDQRVANDEPATLAAKLVEDDGTPIAGRPVTLVLGGTQGCSGTTGTGGVASCQIPSVDQDLNSDGTLPVHASFAGDAYYEPSLLDTRVKLQFMTGRAFGLSASGTLPLGLALSVPRTPDTGQIRTPDLGFTSPPCVATLPGAVAAKSLCASVRTKTAPGHSTAKASTAQVTVGLPGLPVIVISDVASTSDTSCSGSSGGVTVGSVTVGGTALTLVTGPNSTVAIPGLPGAKLVVNEQLAVAGADQGLAVVGVHLIIPPLLGVSADVLVASATSDVHHCR